MEAGRIEDERLRVDVLAVWRRSCPGRCWPRRSRSPARWRAGPGGARRWRPQPAPAGATPGGGPGRRVGDRGPGRRRPTDADGARAGPSRPVQREALVAATSGSRTNAAGRGARDSLAPRLPEPLLGEALAAARTLTDEEARAEALAPWPHSSGAAGRRGARRGGAHRRRAPAGQGTRGPRVLACPSRCWSRRLAPCAPSPTRHRAEALTAIAPHLSVDLTGRDGLGTLAAARGTSEELRVEGLAALAPTCRIPCARGAGRRAVHRGRALAGGRWRRWPDTFPSGSWARRSDIRPDPPRRGPGSSRRSTPWPPRSPIR